jgi:hypothetical protein
MTPERDGHRADAVSALEWLKIWTADNKAGNVRNTRAG